MQLVMLATLIVVFVLAGVLTAITPFLMPASECFAVTVPESAQALPQVRSIKRSFVVIVLVATAVLGAAVFAASLRAVDNPDLWVWWYLAGFAVLFIVSAVMYLVCRNRVRALKAAEGWRASGQRVSSVMLGGDDAIRIPSLWWGLVYVLETALAGALAWALYPVMPAEIPMQVDLAGNVSRVVEKGPAVAWVPALIVGFLSIVFFLSQVAIAHSKRSVNPDAPQASARAYLLFARAQCRLLIGMGTALGATFGVTMPLSMAGIVPLPVAGIIILVVALVAVAAAVGVTLVFGQSGSKLLARWQDASGKDMPQDFDASWKLGVFYVNKRDPSVIVPKRFGIGWTVNLARPAAWIGLVGAVVLVAAFIWVVVRIA